VITLDAIRAYTLSDYRWDEEAGVYRYPNGVKVSDRALFQAIYRHNTRISADLLSTTRRYLAGDFGLEEWERRVKERIKENHETLFAFGKGGAGYATATDKLDTVRYLQSVEYSALSGFAKDIRSGKLSEAQIKHRITLYAYHSKVSYERGKKSLKSGEGTRRARRTLGPCVNHCSDCLSYAALGWVRLEELVLPGDRCQCGAYCCCSVEYEPV
jgi:hypothetical protein